MKQKLLFAVCLACMAMASNGQAPNAIPYQAVARDNSGNIIANQNISLRFSIHNATVSGTVVYSETQSATSNSLGLFSVNVGQGIVISGTFSSIAWNSGNKFLQVFFWKKSNIRFGGNRMQIIKLKT